MHLITQDELTFLLLGQNLDLRGDHGSRRRFKGFSEIRQ